MTKIGSAILHFGEKEKFPLYTIDGNRLSAVRAHAPKRATVHLRFDVMTWCSTAVSDREAHQPPDRSSRRQHVGSVLVSLMTSLSFTKPQLAVVSAWV
ncbi:hypothetical protein SAMN04488564_102201 [Lentzea waywayandensis]|uniref:Uncharacterized protein n=1 Tax=Lentzea waywayandensis TaxID=84724 RepID=A0A1I6DC07_9PSEU|nr:hypothetical protein SAMN04488564_102201 [Lentzea waywayandensis]